MNRQKVLDILFVIVIFSLFVFVGRGHAAQQSIFREAKETCMEAGYPEMVMIETYEGKRFYCANEMEAVRIEEVK